MSTAWSVLDIEAPELDLIKLSYKEKMRKILDGDKALTATELNAAYNEVKTEEKLKAYLRKFPFPKKYNPVEVQSAYTPVKKKRKLFPDPEDVEPEAPTRTVLRTRKTENHSAHDDYMYDWDKMISDDEAKETKQGFDKWGRWRKGLFRY